MATERKGKMLRDEQEEDRQARRQSESPSSLVGEDKTSTAMKEEDVDSEAAQSKYIAKVRETCSRETFDEFLALVEDHRAKPMREVDVIVPRLTNLFQSHEHEHELIAGFDVFLPEGSKIMDLIEKNQDEWRFKHKVEDDVFLPEGGKIIDLIVKDQDEWRFKNKVEEVLNPDTYHAFLNLMMEFKEMKITVDEACNTAKLLFKNHPNLLSKFTTLLFTTDRNSMNPPPRSA